MQITFLDMFGEQCAFMQITHKFNIEENREYNLIWVSAALS